MARDPTRTWRKAVVVTSGVAALGVLAAATLVGWDDLCCLYYRHLLEKDPERILAFARSGPQTPRGRALRSFAETAAGKDALLLAYIEAASKANPTVPTRLRENGASQYDEWFLFWCWGTLYRIHGYTDIPDWSFRGGGGGGHVDGGLATDMSALQAAMLEVGYESHTLRDYPGLAFTLYSKDRLDPDIEYRFLRWDSWPEGRVLVAEHMAPGNPFRTGRVRKLKLRGPIQEARPGTVTLDVPNALPPAEER
jgi:hypothetical protein